MALQLSRPGIRALAARDSPLVSHSLAEAAMTAWMLLSASLSMGQMRSPPSQPVCPWEATESVKAPSLLVPASYGTPSSGNLPGSADAAENPSPSAPAENRRALPAPFPSPPFPNAEYQGFPLVGVPVDTTRYPLMTALQGTWPGDLLDSHRIRAYGWINGSGNVSNCKNSNTISSYWVVPNNVMLDQAVLRLERQVDTVQTDHIDWGFRSTVDYGIDYRYFTAGGWISDQLLVHNRLYGVDPTEQYFNLYFPCVGQGMIVTIGRWIACPDIETQFAPDNYMGTHSIQFTVDVYTETGVMATVMLDKQWTVQACIHAGADMAPWYPGAVPTGMFVVPS